MRYELPVSNSRRRIKIAVGDSITSFGVYNQRLTREEKHAVLNMLNDVGVIKLDSGYRGVGLKITSIEHSLAIALPENIQEALGALLGTEGNSKTFMSSRDLFEKLEKKIEALEARITVLEAR